MNWRCFRGHRKVGVSTFHFYKTPASCSPHEISGSADEDAAVEKCAQQVRTYLKIPLRPLIPCSIANHIAMNILESQISDLATLAESTLATTPYNMQRQSSSAESPQRADAKRKSKDDASHTRAKRNRYISIAWYVHIFFPMLVKWDYGPSLTFACCSAPIGKSTC